MQYPAQLSQTSLGLLIDFIDANLEQFQDKLIENLGGDPGHDIGDASLALELLNNIACPDEPDEFAELIVTINQTLHHMGETTWTPAGVASAFTKLLSFTADEYNEILQYFMQRLKPERQLITIYFPHYFDGEYDLKELLKNHPQNPHANQSHAWIFREIHAGTWTKAIQYANNIDEDEANEHWKDFLNILYPRIPDGYILEYPQHILGIQYYDIPDPKDIRTKKTIADILIDIATDIMTNASGDDDTYDYAPDTIHAIACILEQMGFTTEPKNLNHLADTMGEDD